LIKELDGRSLHSAALHASAEQAMAVAPAALVICRFPDCALRVTLQPGAMCAGAIQHGRIARLVSVWRRPLNADTLGFAVCRRYGKLRPRSIVCFAGRLPIGR
jgi:tRNA(Arg) A34 adenosine deaminase TadA